MITGLLLLVAAQAGAASPPDSAAEPAPAGTVEPCRTDYPKDGEQEIVICVERQQGYRLNPDVSEASRRAKRNKLKRPERFVDRSCDSVGGHGCGVGGGIDVVAAALTAAEMARRAVTGENVGEMFITDPQPDEYQLYLQAKREREAKKAAEAEILKAEAEARAKAVPEE